MYFQTNKAHFPVISLLNVDPHGINVFTAVDYTKMKSCSRWSMPRLHLAIIVFFFTKTRLNSNVSRKGSHDSICCDKFIFELATFALFVEL